MAPMKLDRSDFIHIGLLLAFSIAIWLPSRFYPLFWDSTAVVDSATRISQGDWHTASLFPALLALFWQVFGTQPLIAHYLTLPFLPLLLVASYVFIKSATNRLFGFIGAFMIAFTPVVLAEYVNVYVDLPMAALVALSLVSWDLKKYPLWAIFYAAAILTKLPAIIVAPYFLVKARQADDKSTFMSALIISIISAIVFLNLNPNILNPADITRPSVILTNLLQIFITLFTSQGKWLFFALVLLVVFQQYRKIGRNYLVETAKVLSAELAVLGASVVIFFLTGDYNFRSSIFLLVFLYAAGLKVIYAYLTQNPKWSQPFVIAFIVVLAFFATLWRPIQTPYTTSVYNPPDDLGITDYLQVFRWLASYAALNRDQNIIYYGGFPENISLTEPKMGFIDNLVPFQNCEDFVSDPSLNQIIILHPFSPTSYPCYQIIQSLQLTAYSGTEVNGKWLDLYSAPVSTAADIPQKP